tara:strand:+ start:123 stop:731 length:609 start_codon:yes stop_codon:yes gene_type:complete
MKYFTVDAPCVIKPFLAHDAYKTFVLTAINDDPMRKEISAEGMKIWTDYRPEVAEYTPPYWEPIKDDMTDHMQKVLVDDLRYNRMEMGNIWFQQYEEGFEHRWHVHDKTMFTSVYYLEHPEGSPPTEILNTLNGDISKVDCVQEGDILTFPSFIVHRAPTINEKDCRKTIISWHNEVEFDRWRPRDPVPARVITSEDSLQTV